MNSLKPLNLVPHKISENRVILSVEVLSQLVAYVNTQATTINSLMAKLQDLTKTVNTLRSTESNHHVEATNTMSSLQKDLETSVDKLQTQISTLAKSISIFLGGE